MGLGGGLPKCQVRDLPVTLTAKFDDAALTGVEIDMKVVIDQMREQVQNVE
ncbi:DUF1732 domain-containing protein [Pontibrevibacter nitratireducens]|uniref:DUF1732 domain-containing protein n=1 Tax=Pontivivens nitratireducens TaxID=2758038 RepID=A0A6G7VQB1_9RHOB|nr:DUF1732 domain-containing protein [Pontibrevibacter nitratireducens]